AAPRIGSRRGDPGARRRSRSSQRWRRRRPARGGGAMGTRRRLHGRASAIANREGARARVLRAVRLHARQDPASVREVAGIDRPGGVGAPEKYASFCFRILIYNSDRGGLMASRCLRRTAGAVFLWSLALGAAPARAQTTFTNRTAWETAAGPNVTIRFEGIAPAGGLQ